MDNTTEQLSCSIETITPQMASEWLAIERSNRPIAGPTVNRLVGILQRDEWREDSTDAIGLAPDGRVVNGQHRLQAIFESGKTVKALVYRNVQPDVIKILDQGRPRTFAQQLALDSFANPAALSSACQWLYRFENGFVTTQPEAHRPTIPQLEELLGRVDGALEQAVVRALPLSERKFGLHVGIGAAMSYLFAVVDETAAAEYFEQIAEGENLTKDFPAYWVREALMDNALADHKKVGTVTQGAWVVKGWNALLSGTVLKRKPSRPANEPFPAISGVTATVEQALPLAS